MTNITDTNRSETNLVSVITGCLIVCCLYAIGIYLHIKIIIVSKREKDMTWKIDITNSLMVIITYTFSIFMHTITYIIEDLHSYTGEWFCYASLAILYSLVIYISSHSTVILTLKYIVIVHGEKIRNFGKEKIIELFFWFNILHPMLDIVLRLIIRPDFWFVYGGFTQINRCLGSTSNTTTLLSLCDFPKPMHQDSFGYTLYISKRVICVLQTVMVYANSWQLFDMLFYWRIFAYARR